MLVGSLLYHSTAHHSATAGEFGNKAHREGKSEQIELGGPRSDCNVPWRVDGGHLVDPSRR